MGINVELRNIFTDVTFDPFIDVPEGIESSVSLLERFLEDYYSSDMDSEFEPGRSVTDQDAYLIQHLEAHDVALRARFMLDGPMKWHDGGGKYNGQLKKVSIIARLEPYSKSGMQVTREKDESALEEARKLADQTGESSQEPEPTQGTYRPDLESLFDNTEQGAYRIWNSNLENQAFRLVAEAIIRGQSIEQTKDSGEYVLEYVADKKTYTMVLPNPTQQRVQAAAADFRTFIDYVKDHKDEVLEAVANVYVALSLDQLDELPPREQPGEDAPPLEEQCSRLSDDQRNFQTVADGLYERADAIISNLGASLANLSEYNDLEYLPAE
jgi:hypothetical protein